MADNGDAVAGAADPAPELSAADNATNSPSGDASPPSAADTTAAATAGDNTPGGGDAAPSRDGNGDTNGAVGGGGSDDNAPASTASAPGAVSAPPPAPPAAATDDAPVVATSAGQAASSPVSPAAAAPVSPAAGPGSPTARERTSSVGSGGSGAAPRRNRKAMTRASSMRAGKGKVGAAAARRKSLLYAGNVAPSAAARPRHTSSLRNLAEGDDAAEAAEPAEASAPAAAAPASGAPATAGAPPGGEATPPASSSGASVAGSAANNLKKPPGRMTGVMSKMGHLFKTWKKRYFVLEGSTLRYFTDASMDKQKGQIELEVGTTVTPGSKGARHCCLLIMGPGGKTDLLVDAGDEATMDAWEKALLANVKKPTPAELAADTTPVAAAAPE